MASISSMTDLERRAYLALHRRRISQGVAYNEPAEVFEDTDAAGRKYVILTNVNGVLAVYRVRNDGMLRLMKRPPQEILAAR